MPSVLVADHEPEVAEMARRYLERASMRVLLTRGPAQTLRALAGRSADLFVVDLTMPGLEVRGVRQVLTAGIPVVFLLDRADLRPHGLNTPPAARRWLTRPFSPRALVVAVTDLLHPVPAQSRAGRADPSARADRGRHEIVLDGRDVSLTRTEFALVSALAEQPGRVLSRQRLLTALEIERASGRARARSTSTSRSCGPSWARTSSAPSTGSATCWIWRGRTGRRGRQGWLGNAKVSRMHCEGKLQGGRRGRAPARASIGGATFPI